MVTTATTTGITVISICNYDRYQFPVEVATTPVTTEATTPTTTNKKEVKEYSVGAPPEVSITKVIFDSAVSYLGNYGRDEKEARSLCAKWINGAFSEFLFYGIPKVADAVRAALQPARHLITAHCRIVRDDLAFFVRCHGAVLLEFAANAVEGRHVVTLH